MRGIHAPLDLQLHVFMLVNNLPPVSDGDKSLVKKNFIENLFRKYDQVSSFLRIWSHLQKKSVLENFLFCALTERTNEKKTLQSMGTITTRGKPPEVFLGKNVLKI